MICNLFIHLCKTHLLYRYLETERERVSIPLDKYPSQVVYNIVGERIQNVCFVLGQLYKTARGK